MSVKTKKAIKFYLQVFLGAALASFMTAGIDVFSLGVDDLKTLVNAGIGAVVPLLYKALNKNDPDFGRSK